MEAPRGCYQLNKHIAELQDAVELEHDCAARPLASMPVTVTCGDQQWQGMVAAFELEQHIFAQRCYAWPVVIDGEITPVTQLKMLPIVSAEDAVRTWLERFQPTCSKTSMLAAITRMLAL
ncbi:MAG: hypothetical protein ACJ8KX_00560 [Chthoniobacterales bacterium]